MRRREFVRLFAALRGDAVVITGPGGASGALYEADDRPATIYNMDMGYAAAMCLGIALGDPGQRVVAIEGDGSMLAGMGVLSTIGRYQPANLALIVVDNGVYASTGGTEGAVPTAAGTSTDLAALARACGLAGPQVLTADSVEGAGQAVRRALTLPGPWVVIVRVDPADPGPRQLPGRDLVETSLALQRELAGRRSARARVEADHPDPGQPLGDGRVEQDLGARVTRDPGGDQPVP
jgi:thiamine pyrophosphate-dependent acetolactate synthase large subunit-like protein